MTIYWLYQECTTAGGILTWYIQAYVNIYGELNIFTGGYC
jgi:hypothetical protein